MSNRYRLFSNGLLKQLFASGAYVFKRMEDVPKPDRDKIRLLIAADAGDGSVTHIPGVGSMKYVEVSWMPSPLEFISVRTLHDKAREFELSTSVIIMDEL